MQELVISEEQLMQFIGQYIWPLMRISAFYFAVPVIGARTVPARVRIILSLFTVIILVPVLPPAPVVSFLSAQGFMMVIQEVLIGLALGFCMQVVMHVFVLAGQFIAMKMGLGFAAMNDPSSGVSVTILSQFYLLLSTLLFLSVNGHLVVLQLMIDSYNTFPIGGAGMNDAHFSTIVGMGSWLFSAALLITLPLFTSLLIVNMSFGVMSRSAPQMNVFTVGFPITLILGFILMWFTFANFLPVYFDIMEEGIGVLRTLALTP
ncbi:flagellar biosynthetic protein FliR [Cellvibrio mixtus]|jgi:flagellar biosynthetic protein FliR|uniref:Flagellar biosynthetic protein FliR n=1 Tax=Cellvibrio mixtus TaxID=39650 RepID=A0A266Q557_9GAMM|nr:flagellar biosynthetic protein FliR [Cellvibrio mixtus]OZY84975.1 flagellar biosynthetic protein FliR [Cellvibrio mixtus]